MVRRGCWNENGLLDFGAMAATNGIYQYLTREGSIEPVKVSQALFGGTFTICLGSLDG